MLQEAVVALDVLDEAGGVLAAPVDFFDVQGLLLAGVDGIAFAPAGEVVLELRDERRYGLRRVRACVVVVSVMKGGRLIRGARAIEGLTFRSSKSPLISEMSVSTLRSTSRCTSCRSPLSPSAAPSAWLTMGR